MTPTKNGPFQIKKRISNSDRITVMFIKGTEKLRTFRISAPFLFGGLIFFAFYVVLSIIFVNLYFSEIRAFRSQSQRLVQLQEQINDTRQALEGAKERLRVLDGRVFGTPEHPEQTARSGETDSDNSLAAGQELKWVEQYGSPLDVQRFAATKDRQQLRIRFRLVNIDPDNRPISGYVIMIAVSSEDPPQYWAYPKLTLKNGLPVNFEDGEYFKIRNYRTVRGRFAIEDANLPPAVVQILAYKESGLRIMKKEMDLDK